jgi:Tfp pilus assembly protein PilN
MQRLLSKIFSINEIQVVGVYQDTNIEKYTILSLKKDKNKLDILNSISVETKEDLISNIDIKKAVILVLDGKGILNKKIVFDNEDDLNWQKNIDYNSIYHTSYKTENDLFISFCRKNVLDEWVNFFQNNSIKILDFYLGNFVSSLVNDQFKEPILVSTNSELIFEENELIDYRKTNKIEDNNYFIENINLNSFSIPLYAVGIHFFVKDERISKSEYQTRTSEEALYKKAFNTFGLIMLVGFFVLLLISYFGIQHYTSKNAELNIKNVYSNKAYQQIVNLERQKQDKETIIKDVGLLSNKFLSFYSYELFQSIPNQILLTEIDIYPIEKEFKNNEKINITAGKIEVKGITVDENAFNQWLKDIKQFNWIKKFEIESLKKDKKNNTQFTIYIWLK